MNAQSQEKLPKNEFMATFEPYRYRTEKRHDTESFGGHTLSRNMATLQNYRGLCHINSQAIAQVEVTLEEERHMTEF